jgi:hypothetical protein
VTLTRKINGIPIDEITYMEMTNGITHEVVRGSLQGCIDVANEGIDRLTFVNGRMNRVTVRYDCIREVSK